MPNRSAIRGAILQGVRKANLDYEQWSRGWWLSDSGVEGLMVATIARKLVSKFSADESLLMECPFDYIEEWSEANPRPGRPPKTLKGKGKRRADIVLFDGTGSPTWVVEVKRKWDKTQCFGDLERVRDLVLRYGPQRTGTLRGGFLAMMLAKKESRSKSADERVLEQAGKIKKAITSEFDPKGLTLRCRRSEVRNLPKEFREDTEDWAHVSLSIEIASPGLKRLARQRRRSGR